jgi:hypothetical protein
MSRKFDRLKRAVAQRRCDIGTNDATHASNYQSTRLRARFSLAKKALRCALCIGFLLVFGEGNSNGGFT